jgi:hypothetical protein
MAGRGLRVDSARSWDEQDCLLMDVVGASGHNDLRSLVDLSTRKLDPDKAHSARSLTDLEDELDAGPGVPLDEAEYWRGETVTREFDPLGRPSTKVWLRTKGGTYFVPAGKTHFVFIVQWPRRGQWSVASCGKRVADGRPVMTEHRALPLDQALVWAADLAYDLGAATLNASNKSAPWRKKRASDALVDFARNLGIPVAGTTDPVTGLFSTTERQGELSDRINEITGTRRIDPIVKAMRGGS